MHSVLQCAASAGSQLVCTEAWAMLQASLSESSTWLGALCWHHSNQPRLSPSCPPPN